MILSTESARNRRRQQDCSTHCHRRNDLKHTFREYLFPDKLVVEFSDDAVLRFHLLLEVGHELVGVILRLQNFVLP